MYYLETLPVWFKIISNGDRRSKGYMEAPFKKKK